MAGPKNKTSRSKRGHRRSHHTASFVASAKCGNCGDDMLPHMICPSCGYYKSRQVLNKSEV